MDYIIIYLNNFYLYILSFYNKNKTTFKYFVSAVPFGINNLCYLLIKLINYFNKFNLSKFDLNLFELNGDWGLGIGDWGLGTNNINCI